MCLLLLLLLLHGNALHSTYDMHKQVQPDTTKVQQRNSNLGCDGVYVAPLSTYNEYDVQQLLLCGGPFPRVDLHQRDTNNESTAHGDRQPFPSFPPVLLGTTRKGHLNASPPDAHLSHLSHLNLNGHTRAAEAGGESGRNQPPQVLRPASSSSPSSTGRHYTYSSGMVSFGRLLPLLLLPLLLALAIRDRPQVLRVPTIM